MTQSLSKFVDQALNSNLLGLAEALGAYDTLLSNNDVRRFPPVNIIKDDDNHWTIELAVAGYGRDDLSVTLEKTALKIKGELKRDEGEPKTYIKRGIALRNFEEQIFLPEGAAVGDVELVNGLLKIKVYRIEVRPEVKRLAIK
jgi:molecular chaperone IbpA